MIELLTQQACINFIGRKTIVKFSFASEGILEYEMPVPLFVSGDYLKVTLEVFFHELDDFYCYDLVGQLLQNKQLFELRTESIDGVKQTLYHKKWNGE